MLTELKYNQSDIDSLDMDGYLIVFRGNVYTINIHDHSEANIKKAFDLARMLCQTYTGMSDIFFEKNGQPREIYLDPENPGRILNALANFESVPRLLFGTVEEGDGPNGYDLTFYNDDNYDVARSPEMRQLVGSGILNRFNDIIINDTAYTAEELKQQFANPVRRDGIPEKVYHGTVEKYIADIIRKGLRQVGANSSFPAVTNDGCVFFTSLFATAAEYARHAAAMFGKSNNGETSRRAVIEIDGNKLDPNKILLDWDAANSYSADSAENSPYDNIKPTDQNSRFKGNVLRNSDRNADKSLKFGYNGIVMPAAITKVYVYDGSRYIAYTPEEYLQQLSRNTNEATFRDGRYAPDDFDSLPDPVKLYHSTNEYGLADMLRDGEMIPVRRNGDSTGELWFSTKPQGYCGNCLISIQVPKSDFENGHFRFMNERHVTLPFKETLPLSAYSFKVEVINGVKLSDWFEISKTPNDISEFMKWIGTAADFDPTNCYSSNGLILRNYFPYGNLKDEGWIEESVNNEVEAKDIDMKQFQPRKTLHPKIWVNDKLNSRVRLRLLDIADDFIKEMAVDWIKPEDIVFTGSLANYNWSKYSDIDLHIMMDYSKVHDKKEMVEDYFSAKKEMWLNEHPNLKIYGFPVEVYVEDTANDNPSSGVYSLEKNEWIVEPDDFQDAKVNEKSVTTKAAQFINDADKLIDKLDKETVEPHAEKLTKQLEALFKKLRNLRAEGLASGGEMSSGNIIWKICRRMGCIEKIWKAINSAYDRIYSIKEGFNFHGTLLTEGMWDKDCRGWLNIGIIKGWCARISGTDTYLMVDPKAPEMEDRYLFRDKYTAWSSKPEGEERDCGTPPTYYLQYLEIYPEYRDTYYGEVFLGKRRDTDEDKRKHEEFLSKLYIVGNEVILHHDSSRKIENGVVSCGHSKNGYSNNSDIGAYFWGSPKSGSDPSNVATYTYYCKVPVKDIYDFDVNVDRLTLTQALSKYGYAGQTWGRTPSAICVNSYRSTPIWFIQDRRNGKCYDKDWNEIKSPI